MSSSMEVSLTYRNTGPWGAGKGARLTSSEVDDNFWTLAEALLDFISDPVQPRQIGDISVTGNQITITLDDGVTVFGPYTLPVAAIEFTGAWQASHAYKANNLFTANSAVYFVNRDFTSGASFVPSLGTGIGGVLPYASLLMPYPTGLDIGFFAPGKPGNGLDAGETMFGYLARRDFTLPAGLTGSLGYVWDAPTADLSFPICNGPDEIGSVDIAAGTKDATFTFTADSEFRAADKNLLRVLCPAAVDDTAKTLFLTFAATLGVTDESSS